MGNAEENISTLSGDELARKRVDYLVGDLHRMGRTKPTREEVAQLVQATFRSALTLREKDQLADLTLEALRPAPAPKPEPKAAPQPKAKAKAKTKPKPTPKGDTVAEPRGEDGRKLLSKAQTKRLVAQILTADPEARGPQVWEQVLEHGTPPWSKSTFTVKVMAEARKRLGITAKAGPRLAPAPAPAPADREADTQPAQPAPAQLEASGTMQDGTRPSLEITTPQGYLRAVQVDGSTAWLVEFRGQVDDTDVQQALVDCLLADLGV